MKIIIFSFSSLCFLVSLLLGCNWIILGAIAGWLVLFGSEVLEDLNKGNKHESIH